MYKLCIWIIDSIYKVWLEIIHAYIVCMDFTGNLVLFPAVKNGNPLRFHDVLAPFLEKGI